MMPACSRVAIREINQGKQQLAEALWNTISWADLYCDSNSHTILSSSCLLKEVRCQRKACQLCSFIH